MQIIRFSENTEEYMLNLCKFRNFLAGNTIFEVYRTSKISN